jgi:hypothetical protein
MSDVASPANAEPAADNRATTAPAADAKPTTDNRQPPNERLGRFSIVGPAFPECSPLA